MARRGAIRTKALILIHDAIEKAQADGITRPLELALAALESIEEAGLKVSTWKKQELKKGAK